MWKIQWEIERKYFFVPLVIFGNVFIRLEQNFLKNVQQKRHFFFFCTVQKVQNFSFQRNCEEDSHAQNTILSYILLLYCILKIRTSLSSPFSLFFPSLKYTWLTVCSDIVRKSEDVSFNIILDQCLRNTSKRLLKEMYSINSLRI